MVSPRWETLGLLMDLGNAEHCTRTTETLLAAVRPKQLQLCLDSLGKRFGATDSTFNKRRQCLPCRIHSDNVFSKFSNPLRDKVIAKEEAEGLAECFPPSHMSRWKLHIQRSVKLFSGLTATALRRQLLWEAQGNECVRSAYSSSCLPAPANLHRQTYLRVSARVCSFGRLSRFCVSLPGSSVLTHFTVISEGIITDGG